MYTVCVEKKITLDKLVHIIEKRQSMKTEGDTNAYEFCFYLVLDIFLKW